MNQRDRERALARVRADIIRCERCPRLVRYRRAVAKEKRRAFSDWTYWGKPVPGFGASDARLLIIGLAPAAHGGNRTGRVFTGDRSGDFLYAALHRAGLANQPTSTSCDDGLQLIDTYVNAAVRCAPPGNKPTRDETVNCRRFLLREIELLPTRVVVALGKFAFDSYLAARTALGLAVPKPRPKFGHLAAYDLAGVTLIGSYHPSQRNTQTGFLTEKMFDAVFDEAKRLLEEARPASVGPEAATSGNRLAHPGR